jgi:O-antigen ligase
MTPARHAAATLAWAMLIALIPLAPVLGSAASIAASIAAIALAPFAIGKHSRSELRDQPEIIALIVVFVVLLACFAITANEPRDVLFAFNFISLPLAAVVFLVARRSDRGRPAVATIAILCLAGTFAAVLVAMNDIFFRHVGYVYGFNMGPHVVARIALLFGFLSPMGLFVTRSRWRFLLYLGPLAGLAVVYLSGTRGALPAVPILALIFLGFLVADRARIQVALIATIAIAAFVALALASDRLASIGRIASELLTTGATSDASTAQRLAMLSAAWQLYAVSPIVGHGWANFAAVAYPILGTTVGGGPADPFFQFHNDLANFAVAAGMIGVLCWLVLLIAPVVGAFMSPRDTLFRVRLYCCLQLSASYAVFGLTDFTLGYDLPTTLYAFLTAIVLGAFREPQPAPSAPAAAVAP